ETMTGQNIGAQRFDRAERANYVAALGMFLAMTLLGVAIFFLSPFIVSIFTNNEQVISVGAEFLKYISLTFGFVGSARVFSGGFRGAGKTMVAAGIAVLILGVIRYPSALFLSGRLGRTGIWWAFVISNVAALFIAYSWFKQGTWKRKIIKEEAEKGEVAEELSTIEETITE
ncbi:MATE family efflux transporter, partial [Candidatus Bipolaricaulota bacterium]|nr:MATE family efflux transporter [Candidatus Bipolaricaulota bacterium]